MKSIFYEKENRRATINESAKYEGVNLTTYSFNLTSKKWSKVERGFYKNIETAKKDASAWTESGEYIQYKEKNN